MFRSTQFSFFKTFFLITIVMVFSNCSFKNKETLTEPSVSAVSDGSATTTTVTTTTSSTTIPNAPLANWPVDLVTPLFQDDFNRPDELLTTNTKWTSFMGQSASITNLEINTTDNLGLAYLLPNKPSMFPALDKVYLESSVRMDGMGNQSYVILPYSDLTSMTAFMGCVFEYQSGSLIILAGNYGAGTPTQIATLSNFTMGSKIYVGCEVDQVTGIITAYLNSILIGKVEGLTIPTAANSAPFIYPQGDGITIDNVKAFNSFSEGRTPDNGDLRIYNTPYATYYADQLSSFYLQGYCANNGATVQVKDLTPNTYQSATAICTNNSFGINLNLSDLTRFSIGTNRLRIEYVNAGNTQEYFWDFVKSSSSIGPEPATIAYVTKWKTDKQIPNSVPGSQSTADTQIQLPLVSSGIYNFTVDWGDGTSDTIIAWNDPKKLHTYSVAGEYTVSIIGTFTNFSTIQENDSTLFSGDPWKLIDVIQWGDNKWRNMSYMFAGSGLTILSATGNPDTSLVKSMLGMFLESISFNSPVNFDTSNVVNMQQMFTAARLFNQPINFNTSKVVTMNNMFNVADAFNQPINFDTGKVVNMGGMFSNAVSFNSAITFTDTSKVTDMSYMFNGASAFNQHVNFDTSSVTDMRSMFYMARAFNQLVNFDTSSVTNMRGMFDNAEAFNQPINFDTGKVVDMGYMFSGAKAFNQPINFNSSNVTDMGNMFSYTLVFNQPVSLNTSKVTTMAAMFLNAPLFNQPLIFDTASVTTMEEMFSSSSAVSAFNSSITFSNTNNVTNFRLMFNNAIVFNKPVNFDTSGATDMLGMFANATNFNQLVNFNTSNVTDMSAMFAGATAFNRDLSGWTVNPNVGSCILFKQLANPAWNQIPNFTNCNPN